MDKLKDYQPYLDFISSQQEHMMQLTYDWSAVNSGSYNIAGLSKFADILEDNFLWLHADMKKVDLAPQESVDENGNIIEIPLGQALHIQKRPDAKFKVFLGGHMDTVFAKDDPFQQPFFENNDAESGTLRGPGVADMKGGLVVMLKALEALEKTPWADNIGWEVLINSDEEIGSHGSAPLLKEAAKRNNFGMVYEPSLPNGTLVSGRKGSGNFSVIVRGKSAHAGREFDKGRNAIAMLADITAEIYSLNGKKEGMTINPGKFEGGGALNVVPDLAIMRFNIRIQETEDGAWVKEQIDNIIAKANKREGYEVVLHGSFTRKPKIITPEIKELMQHFEKCGEYLGLNINYKATGGCCDGNNLADAGLPNIDTLGVRGANIHSDQEYMLTDSLTERAQLSALMLMMFANGEFRSLKAKD